MFRTATRILLFRVLPRRLFWAMTVVDAIVLLRSLRRMQQSGRYAINQPIRSRTAPPPSPPRTR
jgi:hypothetical protein